MSIFWNFWEKGCFVLTQSKGIEGIGYIHSNNLDFLFQEYIVTASMRTEDWYFCNVQQFKDSVAMKQPHSDLNLCKWTYYHMAWGKSKSVSLPSALTSIPFNFYVNWSHLVRSSGDMRWSVTSMLMALSSFSICQWSQRHRGYPKSWSAGNNGIGKDEQAET